MTAGSARFGRRRWFRESRLRWSGVRCRIPLLQTVGQHPDASVFNRGSTSRPVSQVVNGKTYYAGDLALSFDGSAPYEYGIDFGLLTKDYGNEQRGQHGTEPGRHRVRYRYRFRGSLRSDGVEHQHSVWSSSPFAIDAGTKIASLLSDSRDRACWRRLQLLPHRQLRPRRPWARVRPRSALDDVLRQ